VDPQETVEMVQINVAVVPLGTPVTVVVGELGLVIPAVPLKTLHVPVPTAGVLAASVNDVPKHWD
jgi:hypothetical protein